MLQLPELKAPDEGGIGSVARPWNAEWQSRRGALRHLNLEVPECLLFSASPSFHLFCLCAFKCPDLVPSAPHSSPVCADIYKVP